MQINYAQGVVPFLVDRVERCELRKLVLLASLRFNAAVHTHEGTEKEKVEAASLVAPVAESSLRRCSRR